MLWSVPEHLLRRTEAEGMLTGVRNVKGCIGGVAGNIPKPPVSLVAPPHELDCLGLEVGDRESLHDVFILTERRRDPPLLRDY